ALVGLVMFVFADTGNQKTVERLDTLTGKRKREDESTASILRKTAFERDKRNFLEMLTPSFPSLQKLFLQADCHIKPSTLFGVGLLLAVLGATGIILAGIKWYLAPMFALMMFMTPWAWLLAKRRGRLKRFAAQLSDALELVARALRAGHSLAAGMHVVAEE